MERAFPTRATASKDVLPAGRLHLFYRGSRKYIQGSLIVSQAVQWWRALRYPEGATQASWVAEIAFRELINSHCLVGTIEKGAEDPLPMPPIGQIRLLSPDGPTLLGIYRDPSRPEPPERREDIASVLRSLQLKAPFSAEAVFDVEPTLEGFLLALIEANKRCHELSRPEAMDIWFLGCHGGKIPVLPPAYAGEGRIELTNKVVRPTSGRYMTINGARVVQPGRPDFEFNIQFAYRLPQ